MAQSRPVEIVTGFLSTHHPVFGRLSIGALLVSLGVLIVSVLVVLALSFAAQVFTAQALDALSVPSYEGVPPPVGEATPGAGAPAPHR